MNYLVSIANRFMSLGTLANTGHDFDERFAWVANLLEAIDIILYPLLIVVGAAGTIYAVVIGVNMARADSTEKREEAKKRLINVVVGIAITIGLILFLKLMTGKGGIIYQMLGYGQGA